MTAADARPVVAPVVLYYRRGTEVDRTLESIASQTAALRDEIIVVDNASGDGVMASIGRNRPEVRVVPLPRNEGYAGGMNAGAALVGDDAEYFLFCTHEVVLADRCLEEMLAVAQTTGAGAVGPRLILAGDLVPWSMGGRFASWGRVAHMTLDDFTAEAVSHGQVDWLDGAVLLVRRDAFRKIGGFDEDFFLYWEDVDIAHRLRQAGFPIVVAARAEALQFTGTMPTYFEARNQLLFWLKHRRATKVLLTVTWQAGRAIADALSRRWTACQWRITGLRDGATGSLRGWVKEAP